MDAIMQFIQSNPITTVSLLALAVIASVLGLMRGRGPTGPDPDDLVPSYKRFNRREIERGDRRKTSQPPPDGRERRQGPRRARD